MRLAGFGRRLARAATLDGSAYSELAADRSATGEALLVVLATGLATGISSLDEGGARAVRDLPAGILLAFIGWVVGASIAYVAGTKVLRGRQADVSWGMVARAVGFAQAPGVLRVFGAIPGLGPTIAIVTLFWQFIAMTVALRQTLGYTSYWRPLGVLAIGFIPYIATVWWFTTLLAVS
ncbi:MAG: hypothetical protein HY330_00780 [Chloroflexi bacterium]|nr:hypothetical protein [Chloroflexota bacterium]